MPTYEYQCAACEHRFEELQSFSDEPLKKCPKCKKKRLERLIGMGAAILFKGTGFYQTDYRSDSYKSAAKADETPPATDKTSKDATPAPAATKETSATAKPSKEKSSGKSAKS
jgi:putative FmdB family regulatory protein